MTDSRIVYRPLLLVGLLSLGFPALGNDDTPPPVLVPRAPEVVEVPCWSNTEAPTSPEAVIAALQEPLDPLQVVRCLTPLLLNEGLQDSLFIALEYASFRAIGQGSGPAFSERLLGGWESVAPSQSLPPIVFEGGPWQLPSQIKALLQAADALELARDTRVNVESRLIVLLSRCGGRAAVEWLARRSNTPGIDLASIQALAQIGGPEAIAALARIAEQGDGEQRVMALAAVSLSDASIPVDNVAPQSMAPHERVAALFNASRGTGPDWGAPDTVDRELASYWALYAADFLATRDQIAAATDLLQDALTFSAESRHRRAALQQLARVAPEAARSPAISLAQDRSMGGDARALLAADPEAAVQIRNAYEQGDIGMKAALLEVAARHPDAEVRNLLDAGATSSSSTLRFLAASLKGQEPAPQDALETAERGPQWLQHRALRALLDSFHGEAIGGDKEIAAQGFRALADSDAPMWCRAEALEALGRAGTMEDLPFLEHYRPHGELGRAASTALARIAAHATEPDEAAETLQVLRETTDFQEAVEAAAAVMVERGVAGPNIAQAQGYITDWKVLGPFRRVMALPPFLPPSASDPPEVIVSGEEEFRWRAVQSVGIPACVSLAEEPGTATHFAYAEVIVSAFESVRIEVRAAGPWRLWINGEVAGEGEAAKPESRYAPQGDGLLNPGINRVLLQCLSENTKAQYCVRILNRQGWPIDLQAQQMPDSGAGQVGLGRSAAESILDTTP